MSEAKQVPLTDLARKVPKDARVIENDGYASASHPVGRYLHEMADEIDRLRAEVKKLTDEIATFRLGKHHNENAELRSEVEALRPDAERWRAHEDRKRQLLERVSVPNVRAEPPP